MSQYFLAAATQGKNHWWRYLLGIFITLTFYLILGTIAAIVLFFCFQSDALSMVTATNSGATAALTEKMNKFLTTPSIGGYLSVNVPFVFGFMGLCLAVVGIHRRSFLGLIRFNLPLRWQRILAGAFVWSCISLIGTGIDYLVHPKNYLWSFTNDWWVILPIALIITPLQTSFEELFFRGYLMQGMALLTHNRFALILSNGILFMLPHLGNPEMQRGWITGLGYLAIGVLLAAITIRDNGLELALGVHAANNLQGLLFSTKDSALPLFSLWQIQITNPPLVDTIAALVSCAVFYAVFFWRQKAPQAS